MLLCLLLAIPPVFGQEALTTIQRNTDLIQLASFYAKNYAPYEWKRDVIGFNLYRLTPWLQTVHHSDDLEQGISNVTVYREHWREARYCRGLHDARKSGWWGGALRASVHAGRRELAADDAGSLVQTGC